MVYEQIHPNIMNKTKLFPSVVLVLLVSTLQSIDSFVSYEGSFPRKIQHSSSLHMGKRLDITEVIKAALSISSKFGVASYKATLAWKTIEDIEFNEDVKVVKHGENITLRVEEYEEMLKELKPLLDEQESKTEEMKSLAEEIKVSAFFIAYTAV